MPVAVRRTLLATASAVALLALAGAGNRLEAQDEVMTSVSNSHMESVLRGMDVEFTTRNETSWRLKLEGATVVLFMGKNNEDAQLYISFSDVTVTPKQMNEWNANHRFGRAYADEDGNPVLESDLDFAGGVTDGTLKAWVDLFGAQIKAYIKYLSDL